jgi:hypothetical protein
MFLQGSAGTGKTFTVKAVISVLQSHWKNCLICGTTPIVAVQYPGGTTVHSLLRLGIDEQSRGGFRSNIGRGTPLARYILAADLIIIDEEPMLTPWVANRVSLTLQSISGHERIEFSGKRIFFVGDLQQLPSIVLDFSVPVTLSPILCSLCKRPDILKQERKVFFPRSTGRLRYTAIRRRGFVLDSLRS